MSGPDVCRFGRVTVGEMTDHTTSTAGQFAARLDRFDRGVPNPPEVARERVAIVLCDVDAGDSGYPWVEAPEGVRNAYRRLADAALAVIGDQQDPAVQRVLALIAEYERERTESVSLAALRSAVAGSDA